QRARRSQTSQRQLTPGEQTPTVAATSPSFRRPGMLEATRTRISFSGEVLTAAAFLAATVLVGLLIVRELRVTRGDEALPAQSTTTTAAVPPEAVSVPALTFGAHEIKVGDSLAATLSRLDPTIKMTNRVVDTGPLGQ